jgi:hypothetical protein
MLKVLLCSMVTILPGYLFRRCAQGKRFGHEITLFTVWFELRWGITLCLILTVSLIATIFYFHPSTKSATSVFRTLVVAGTDGFVQQFAVRPGEVVNPMLRPAGILVPEREVKGLMAGFG